MQTSVMLMEATLLLEQQAKRIEALEAALREIEWHDPQSPAAAIVRAVLTPEQKK